MKYASVCSGVEAASLAWQPLGWEAAWFSEIEPFPCAVLKERFPNVPNLGDMTKIRVENLENGDQRFTNGNGADVIVRGGVDLLVGGTPCQSFSVAGKREGLEGASGLAKTFVELLGSIRPKWFVWENVPGCLSSKSDRGIYDFNFLLAAFAERGYSCGWRILDAQFCRVDGYPRAVPQRRRRVFVVGHLGGWQYPAEVLFEPSCLSGNNPPKRVKGKGFTADVERSVGTASSPWDSSGVNPTLNQCNAGTLRANTHENEQIVCATFLGTQGSKARGVGYSEEHAPTLRAGAEIDLLQVDSCQTLKIRGGKEGGGSENLITIMNQNQVAATLDTHYGDKQGLEDQHVNAGCPNFILEKQEQKEVVCYENHPNDSRVTEMGDSCQALTSRTGTGGGNLPLVQVCFEWHSQDLRAKKINDGCRPTISAGIGMGGANMTTPMLVQECFGVDRRNQSCEPELSASLTTCGDGESRFSEEVNGTLRSNMGDNQTAVAIAENIIGRQVQNGGNGTGAQEELAYTQNTSGVMGVASHATVRRLMPIECERLMGFPDNWTRIPWKGKPEEECPDSPRYKACGNSMCVNVMRWIGMRIEMVERKEKQQ